MEKVSGTTSIFKYDGFTVSGVYYGNFEDLRRVRLKWNKAKIGNKRIETLTLDEILQQINAKKKHGGEYIGIITVITEDPLGGVVYQYGNYRGGEWWRVGNLTGYA